MRHYDIVHVMHSPDASTTTLITSAQAAAILKCSPRTVHRRVIAKELVPAVKLAGPNGAFLFRREDVERLAGETS